MCMRPCQVEVQGTMTRKRPNDSNMHVYIYIYLSLIICGTLLFEAAEMVAFLRYYNDLQYILYTVYTFWERPRIRQGTVVQLHPGIVTCHRGGHEKELRKSAGDFIPGHFVLFVVHND